MPPSRLAHFMNACFQPDWPAPFPEIGEIEDFTRASHGADSRASGDAYGQVSECLRAVREESQAGAKDRITG